MLSGSHTGAEMNATTLDMPFDKILDAADQLPLDDQRQLIDILNRRLAQASGLRIAKDIEEARAEFAAGKCKPVTPEELLREILQ